MKFAIKALGAALVSASFFAPAFAADFKSHHAVSSARLIPGAEVSLNPQPLPPCCGPDSFALVGKGSRGAAVSLNPQPLPPGGLGFGTRRLLAQ